MLKLRTKMNEERKMGGNKKKYSTIENQLVLTRGGVSGGMCEIGGGD